MSKNAQLSSGKNKIIIGLTGSLASGKTTISRIFGKFGYKILNADKIAHKVLENDKTVREKLLDRYGEPVKNKKGLILRKFLADRVFKREKEIIFLNKLIHPRVISEIDKIIKHSGNRSIIIDVPLLIETGFHKKVDKVIVIKTDIKKCFERFLKKRKTKKDFYKRLNFQMPLSEKLKRADFIIDNNGTKHELIKQVTRVLKALNKE